MALWTVQELSALMENPQLEDGLKLAHWHFQWIQGYELDHWSQDGLKLKATCGSDAMPCGRTLTQKRDEARQWTVGSRPAGFNVRCVRSGQNRAIVCQEL